MAVVPQARMQRSLGARPLGAPPPRRCACAHAFRDWLRPQPYLPAFNNYMSREGVQEWNQRKWVTTAEPGAP